MAVSKFFKALLTVVLLLLIGLMLKLGYFLWGLYPGKTYTVTLSQSRLLAGDLNLFRSTSVHRHDGSTLLVAAWDNNRMDDAELRELANVPQLADAEGNQRVRSPYDDENRGGSFGTRRYEYTTVISRLDEKHQRFEAEWQFPTRAMVHHSKDAEEATWLLTEMDIVDPDNNNRMNRLTAIFQADDTGAHWQLSKYGFMPEANHRFSTYSDLLFQSADQIWYWGDVPEDDSVIKLSDSRETGLWYSEDAGRTATEVAMPDEQLAPSDDELSKDKPDGMPLEQSGRDAERFMAPLDDERLSIWISYDRSYAPRGAQYIRGRLAATRFGTVERRDGKWEFGELATLKGAKIRKMTTSRINGETYAEVIGTPSDSYQEDDSHYIARVNPDTLALEKISDIPNPFWPLNATVEVKRFWVGSDVMVLDLLASGELPAFRSKRGLTYDEKINATPKTKDISATYYSRNGGKSWRRMKRRQQYHYRRPFGLDAENNRLFWPPSDDGEIVVTDFNG